MSEKDACSVLSQELEEMQASRKINSAAINTIEAVVDECKEREKFWVSTTEISPQISFVLYHASRNTRLIFEKMHNRFVHATELRENPKVINDANVVLPELSEMCDLLDSLREREITPEIVEFLRRRTRSLRNTAQKASMLPTVQEETEAIKRDELARELEELLCHLRANLV